MLRSKTGPTSASSRLTTGEPEFAPMMSAVVTKLADPARPADLDAAA